MGKSRPMTGFWATLTPEQQALAMTYTGPEVFGPDEVDFTVAETKRMYAELDALLRDVKPRRERKKGEQG